MLFRRRRTRPLGNYFKWHLNNVTKDKYSASVGRQKCAKQWIIGLNIVPLVVVLDLALVKTFRAFFHSLAAWRCLVSVGQTGTRLGHRLPTRTNTLQVTPGSNCCFSMNFPLLISRSVFRRFLTKSCHFIRPFSRRITTDTRMASQRLVWVDLEVSWLPNLFCFFLWPCWFESMVRKCSSKVRGMFGGLES